LLQLRFRSALSADLLLQLSWHLQLLPAQFLDPHLHSLLALLVLVEEHATCTQHSLLLKMLLLALLLLLCFATKTKNETVYSCMCCVVILKLVNQ
jgi:hypothetical protein